MPDYEEILRFYHVQAQEIKNIQAGVAKVITPQENFCLKECKISSSKLFFIQQELSFLPQRGFCHLSLPILNKDHALWTFHAGKYYSLFPWINGSACDFHNSHHRRAAAKNLARFHKAAKGGGPMRGMRRMYDSWPYYMQAKEQDLWNWREQTAKPKNAFERYFHYVTPYYLQRAQKSRQMLANSAYTQIAQKAAAENTFIHWDVAPRNFMIGGDGEAWLIDFDYCRYDLPLQDIIRLLQRGMKAVDFDLRAFDELLMSYHRIQPISWEELQVIAAFLIFPQRFWRLAERYFNQKEPRNVSAFCKKMEETEIRCCKEDELDNYFLAYYCL